VDRDSRPGGGTRRVPVDVGGESFACL